MARWVLVSDRQPEKPGKYEICRAKGGPLPGYLWNGSYWVTPGHNPTDAVYSWFELDAEDKKRPPAAATADGGKGR